MTSSRFQHFRVAVAVDRAVDFDFFSKHIKNYELYRWNITFDIFVKNKRECTYDFTTRRQLAALKEHGLPLTKNLDGTTSQLTELVLEFHVFLTLEQNIHVDG